MAPPRRLGQPRSCRSRYRVEAALQDIGSGDLVDDFGAALAGHVGGNHLAGNGGGRQPLIPQQRQQVAQRRVAQTPELIACAGCRRPGSINGRPITAPPTSCRSTSEQSRHVVAKAPAADRVERAGDDVPRVDSARPIVLVPTSSPISRVPVGTAAFSAAGLPRIMPDDSVIRRFYRERHRNHGVGQRPPWRVSPPWRLVVSARTSLNRSPPNCRGILDWVKNGLSGGRYE